jgi:hypothetical protein
MARELARRSHGSPPTSVTPIQFSPSRGASRVAPVIGEMESIPSPVGTVERVTRGIFNRPYGTSNVFLCPADPAINRWAIIKSPSGASAKGTYHSLISSGNGCPQDCRVCSVAPKGRSSHSPGLPRSGYPGTTKPRRVPNPEGVSSGAAKSRHRFRRAIRWGLTARNTQPLRGWRGFSWRADPGWPLRGDPGLRDSHRVAVETRRGSTP